MMMRKMRDWPDSERNGKTGKSSDINVTTGNLRDLVIKPGVADDISGFRHHADQRSLGFPIAC